MARLLDAKPDAMIVGRFMGFSSPGKYEYTFKGRHQECYRHNDASFRRLWSEALGEAWELEVEVNEWKEALKLRTLEKPVKTWDVEVKFVGRRMST